MYYCEVSFAKYLSFPVKQDSVMLMPQIIKNFFICSGLFYRNQKFNSWSCFGSNLKLLKIFTVALDILISLHEENNGCSVEEGTNSLF